MENNELIKLAKSVSSDRELTPAATIGGVGSALIAGNGRAYKGKNIDCSCGIGFCAEHSAIAAMITEDETRIEKIVAINADGEIMPPCGRGRELMGQINFDNQKTKIILNNNEEVELKELLPHYWLEKYL